MKCFTLLLLCAMAARQGFAQTTADLLQQAKADMEIVIPGVTTEAGYGNNDGQPAGTAFPLPAGVRIVNRPHKTFDPSPQRLHGNINTFYADVSLVNDDLEKKGAPTLVEFPPGLTMVYIGEGRMQHGMLLERVLIPVPPTKPGSGGNDDTVTVYLGLACINEHRGLPWEANPEGPEDVRAYPIAKGAYRTGYVTSQRGLVMLAELLSQYKRLRLTQHYNPQAQFEEGYVAPKWMAIYSMIQEMVWKVTDGAGITRGDLKQYKEKLAPYK